MGTLIGVLLVLSWVAAIPLLADSVSALNESPKGSRGIKAHASKMLLLIVAAGYFCIVVIAPFDLVWSLFGGAMVLTSKGFAAGYRYIEGCWGETYRRIEDAFDVEL